MADKGKGRMIPETEGNDIINLEQDFAAKLALPPPTTKEAVIDDEVWEELEKGGKKLLAVKVLSPDLVSFGLAHEAIFKAISKVTTLFKLQRCKDLTFVATFDMERDLLSFMYRSPWIVMKNRLLVLKRIDHLAIGARTRFLEATIWLHLENIPEGIRENSKALNALVECAGSLVGKVLIQGNGKEKIVRAKISVPIENPLNVFAVVKKKRTGESLRFLCTYDKAGILCLKCGRLGHWQGGCTEANAHLIPTNRLSYLVAKPFTAYYSPLPSAMSSTESRGRNFRQLAAGVARNISPELSSGGEEQMEDEEHQIASGGTGQTARLSESSDYDPSELSENPLSEGNQIVEIDREGQIRSSRLTLDVSNNESREEPSAGQSMTFSINQDFLQNLAGRSHNRSFIFESVGTSRAPRSPYRGQIAEAQHQQIGSPPPGFSQAIYFGPNLPAGPGRGRGRGRGRGPKKVFSKVPRGPRPEWHLRPACNGLLLIPTNEESPPATREGRNSVLDSPKSGKIHLMQTGNGGVNSLVNATPTLVIAESQENEGRRENQADVLLNGVDNDARRRQVSPPSGQLMPKRQRLEEF